MDADPDPDPGPERKASWVLHRRDWGAALIRGGPAPASLSRRPGCLGGSLASREAVNHGAQPLREQLINRAASPAWGLSALLPSAGLGAGSEPLLLLLPPRVPGDRACAPRFW